MKALPRIGTKAPAGWRMAAALCAALAGIGFVYPTLPSGANNAAHAQAPASASAGLQTLATGAMAAFKATEPPAPVEGIEIVDAAGKPRPLSAWNCSI